MIKFLIKGLIRDRNRSLFPVITVAIGVMLTVVAHSWITGILGDTLESNANFATGHVKIVTRAYAENMDQMPMDLALENVNELDQNLRQEFPEMNWVERIRFGGLLDVPDEKGETKGQGPVIGWAVDLLSNNSEEVKRMNILSSLVNGHVPRTAGEILISEDFTKKLGIQPGDQVTLISSTMYGSMAMYNFTVAGTVQFGIQAMDRGAMVMDIGDAQTALNMTDASSEILGYFSNTFYDEKKADLLKNTFNQKYSDSENEFSPIMLKLKDQNNLSEMLAYLESMVGLFIFVFIGVMSIVLWNAGLLGGLRRYSEVGIRLAIGEAKGHVYRSMIVESVAIGIAGSVLGTLVGLGLAYLLQEKGFDFSSAMKNASMMMPAKFRAQITPPAYFIGFIPGIFSTVIGTMLSGVGIYRRKTAQLFKELEV
ncbi:MAG: ABC transporter permease [Candidatus Zhuqueibacterota bacterium]